ncbi:MAG: aminotransferase class V-fold PLP-dependent enzyme [Actinomycetota bacterium]
MKSTTFLGAHTLGPLSRRVRSAIDGFLDAWERKPSPEKLWFEDIIPEMRRLEGLFAKAIGADPDEVALTPSVSTGLSSLASCMDFGERNEIVLSRQEFPTDCHVWLAQERRGAHVVWVDGKDEDAYRAAIGPRTGVVSASRVSYLDGAMLDPSTLAATCREARVFCILDDYHGSGVVPLDVHATGAEALFGGPLKYLLGGPGISFVYVRRDVAPVLAPTITGWFSQKDFFAFDNSANEWPDNAQRLALGTPSPTAIYAAAAGLDTIHAVGIDRIRARSLELTSYCIERADEAGFTVSTPRDPSRRGGLVAFEVPESKHVLERLLDADVIVDERHGALRVCPHFYSSEDDIDVLFAALKRFG